MTWLFSRALMQSYENSRCSRALVAASLPATCLDGALSAPLSVMPTQHKFWRNDKTMEPSDLSRFGLTCAVLTADRGADLLTWCLEASPARTSALPAAAQGSTAPDPACGPTWRASWAKYDPVSSTWRTAQPSLLGDSDESSVTWPRSGMTAGGQCWELPMLAPRISATDSGLWPTPVASDTGQRKAPHAQGGTPLSLAAANWPTPTSSLGSKGGRVTPRKGREGGTPIEAVSARAIWPTPTVCGNYNRKGASATSGDGLATVVMRETLATPTARDWRSGKASQETHDRNSRPLSGQVGGLLNADWVELLMGWPKGWTDLKPLESADMRGWGDGWEDGTPRVLVGAKHRTHRLKAIGNGQVPLCAATAWRLLEGVAA